MRYYLEVDFPSNWIYRADGSVVEYFDPSKPLLGWLVSQHNETYLKEWSTGYVPISAGQARDKIREAGG